MTRKIKFGRWFLVCLGWISVISAKAGPGEDTLLLKQQLLLKGIGSILERGHYAPKPIDDSLSAHVFAKYLVQLDVEKNLFLQSDIAQLDPYRYTIDDEINGVLPLQFYPSVVQILYTRIDSAKTIYTKILSSPFDFSIAENFQPNRDSIDFPADQALANDAWRRRLKYRVLVSYAELLSQREKAKDADSLKHKTDTELQQMARLQVKGYYDRYFSTRFNKRVFGPSQQFSLLVNTVTHEMDPHTDYFAPVEARDFNEGMSNSFYGIGALMGTKDGQVYIEDIMAGGSAWKSKQLAKGDIILKIGNEGKELLDIAGYSVTEAVKLVRGAKDTKVVLLVKKGSSGISEQISLVREEVKIDQATAKSVLIKDGTHTIGYINLPSFYVDFQNRNNPSCSADMATELKKLKAAKIDGLIVDLRDNPGGSLVDVNKIIGYFVPNGPAVQVRNRMGNGTALNDGNNSSDSVLYDGPLTVMSSENSASASEIFIAAMKDYNRALIVGSTSTYGKGTVQRMLPLGKQDATGSPEFGSLKMTVEKFYRINGGSNQLNGVESDIVIPDANEVTYRREKDEPSALAWDKITPANYKVLDVEYNREAVIAKSQERIAANKKFRQLMVTNEWLRTNLKTSQSLQLSQYQERQENIKKMIERNGQDTSVNKLNITVLTGDHDKFYNNPDAIKQKWYQDWLNAMAKDTYIQENVHILNDMLSLKKEEQFAKKLDN